MMKRLVAAQQRRVAGDAQPASHLDDAKAAA
jgi:hypothetical protein